MNLQLMTTELASPKRHTIEIGFTERNQKVDPGGLEFKANVLLYHSTLDSRVIKKREGKEDRQRTMPRSAPCPPKATSINESSCQRPRLSKSEGDPSFPRRPIKIPRLQTAVRYCFLLTNATSISESSCQG